MRSSQAQALRDMGFTLWVRRAAPGSAPDVAVGAAPSASSAGSESPSNSPFPLHGKGESVGREHGHDGEMAPADWAALEAAVSGCTRCALAAGRQHTVFGVGARNARWLLVGEAPGAEEDRRGEPFVGRAGRLLDAMLAALGLGREEVFITNIVKCRPPGNRDPKPEEAAACRSYLERQIEWIAPALILALGRVAAQQLLGVDTPVGRLRGRVHGGPRGTPVVVTYHPAYLLRTPIAKRKAWEDLRLAVATAAPRP